LNVWIREQSGSIVRCAKAVLKEFRSVFYRDRKKIIPKELGGLLDAMALSVWFMDDGGRGARTPKGLVFNTSCYSEAEQVALQLIFAEEFGVQVSIHKVGRGFQLYIRSGSFERFARLISPHIVPSMRYKLPIDPVTTSSLRGRDGGFVRERTIQYRHNTSALTTTREMKA
jgi:LAGLIDADG DNA endonuclease family protein